MAGPHQIYYCAESEDQRLIEPLDSMTLVYQRRSGITHIVAEPVPEILAAMGSDVVDATTVAERLAADFDMDMNDAEDVVAARLAELASLGLIEQVTRFGA